uniref:Uncharacterized protein n=1 Tax=Rhizophora mucronata TaxID=61149 RepID=A0A2P2MXK1_RHIMU
MQVSLVVSTVGLLPTWNIYYRSTSW